MRLNLGGGTYDIDGWINVDKIHGMECYPLSFPDCSADDIRASHILEHFSHKKTEDVLREWVRVLKPGGTLWVAVPDLSFIIHEFVRGNPARLPLVGYLMGGQMNEFDYHYQVFTENRLTQFMESAGLKDIQRWESTLQDCASYECSLNLSGVKA